MKHSKKSLAEKIVLILGFLGIYDGNPRILRHKVREFLRSPRRSIALAGGETRPRSVEEHLRRPAGEASASGRIGFGIPRILRTGRRGKPGQDSQ